MTPSEWVRRISTLFGYTVCFMDSLTGMGKVASGDDAAGLTRGCLYAGARSVVASLWQVDDATTAKLMTALNKHPACNVEQHEALRLAQIETKKSYPHPFFRAAFHITGAAN